MRRLASEVIRELEARVARLERQASNRNASSNRYADPFLAELQADIDEGMLMADELLAARRPWGGDSQNQLSYNVPHAFKNKNCYGHDKVEGKGPGKGTCYRLHNNYGEANSGKPGSPQRAEYNKIYREKYLNNDSHQDRNKCPDGAGGTMDC